MSTVFHLHINTNAQWLENFNDDGRTYLGIEGVSVYHGQITYYPRDSWRVSNRDSDSNTGEGLNRRDGFNCPRDLGGQWYVGRQLNAPADSTAEDRAWYTALQNWGSFLLRNGYVGTTGLSVILPHPQVLGNGDIDPNNIGEMIEETGQSPALGNGDAYGTNWWIVGNPTRVDTFTPSPPPPWQK